MGKIRFLQHNMMKKYKKVMLMTPPYHCGVVEVAGTWMPLNLAYLAQSAKEAGYEVLLYDAMSLFHTLPQIQKTLKETQPDVLAVTCVTSSFPAALSVLQLAKKLNKDTLTILGGVHPTFCHKDILDEHNNVVDVVIRGEAEEIFHKFLLSLNNGGISKVKGISFHEKGKIISTPPAPFIHDMDALNPAWEILPWNIYTYYVFPGSRLGVLDSSRGCLYACSFCSQQKFWKKRWRAKSPARVIEQIRFLHQAYGVNVLLLSDEYPTADASRWEEILDRLIFEEFPVTLLMETRADDIVRDKAILHKYRQAGIVHVYIGVEAVTQETMDRFNKNLRIEVSREALELLHSDGMITETSFVLGAPWETQESIQHTLQLAKYYNPDFAHFLALAPWPYADMYEQVKPYIKDRDYSKYNLVEAVIEPQNMTLQDVNKAIVSCYKEFYMHRMKTFENYADAFKRKYFLSSMKLVMKSSFLRKHLPSLGKMPVEIEQKLTQEEKIEFQKGTTPLITKKVLARTMFQTVILALIFPATLFAQNTQIQTSLQYSINEFEKLDRAVVGKKQWLGSYNLSFGFPKFSFLPRDIQIQADTRTQTDRETVSGTTTSSLFLSSSEENYQLRTGYAELLSETRALGEKVTSRLLTKNFSTGFAFSKKNAPSFSINILNSKSRDMLTSLENETTSYQGSLRHSFGRLTVGTNFTSAKQMPPSGVQTKSSEIGLEASYLVPIEQHTTTVFSTLLQRVNTQASHSDVTGSDVNILSRLTPYLSLFHRFSLQERRNKKNAADNQTNTDEMTGFSITLSSVSFLRVAFHDQKQKLPAEEISSKNNSLSVDFTPWQDLNLFLNYSVSKKSPQGSIRVWTLSRDVSLAANTRLSQKSYLNYSVLFSAVKPLESKSSSENVSLISEIFSNKGTTLSGVFNRTTQKTKSPGGTSISKTLNLSLTLLLRPDSRTTYSFALTPSLLTGDKHQEDLLFSVSVTKMYSQKISFSTSYTQRTSTLKAITQEKNKIKDFSIAMSLRADDRTNISLRIHFTRNNQADFKEYRNFTVAFNSTF